ncbi:hypothetical protein EV363DRAFT_1454855 [Boletus edulis]|nr:hypothetical protein EV363DRAFT_1454855 [Boletus edulis]
MIKVGQWYKTQKEPRQRKVLYRPTVKFRNVYQDFLNAERRNTSASTQPEVESSTDSDEEVDADTSISPDEDNRDSEMVPVDSDFRNMAHLSETVVCTDEDIDLDSQYLLDILTTVPVPGLQNAPAMSMEKPASLGIDGGAPDWSW